MTITSILIILIVSIILCIIAGVSNSIMDTIQFHWDSSIFSKIENKKKREWWKSKGDKKYKGHMLSYQMSQTRHLWYYFGLYKPKFKEAFPYSTTALVWMTDSWHFFQMIMFSSLQLAIIVPVTFIFYHTIDINWWQTGLFGLGSFTLLKISQSSFFELFWNRILLYKD